MNKREPVYQVVARIPKGKVATYGQIGKLVQLHPRIVGIYLHQNPNPAAVPCHRVVNSKGKLAAGYAFGGSKAQAQRLTQEGVNIKESQVDLSKYLWKAS